MKRKTTSWLKYERWAKNYKRILVNPDPWMRVWFRFMGLK